VLRSRLSALSPRQKRQFLPLAPDLVVELASPTDDLDALHARMREWRDNGVHLGWLILPDQRQVWRYLPHSEPVCLDDLQALQDDERLPGLSLPLAAVWAPML
jgi:Uma2 family endonuclease